MSECDVRHCTGSCHSEAFKGRAAPAGVCPKDKKMLCPAASWGYSWRRLSPSSLSSAEEGEGWGSPSDPHEQTSGARALVSAAEHSWGLGGDQLFLLQMIGAEFS